MSNPVQGWYADPAGTDQLRWWDGTQWTDRYHATTGSNTAIDSDASANEAAISPVGSSALSAAGPTQFTPVPQAPATKATRGQIAIAVVASILAAIFLGSSIVAAGKHNAVQDDVHDAQTMLTEAKEQLQKVREAIQ